MHMTRLFTLVLLAIAVFSTLAEAKTKRIRMTAQVTQTAFTGESDAMPKIGDQIITSVDLFDKTDTKVGTGAGACTIVSLPPLDILTQCLITAVLTDKGQIIFGGIAPLPAIGAVGHFGILGGTDDFRTARGEVTLVVLTPDTQDATFALEIDSERRHGEFTAR
jgi:Allene oxide cyclase barrel like domain